MKKVFSLLLMSVLICSGSFAKDRLPADLSGLTLSPIETNYLIQEGKVVISFDVTIPANYFERRVTFVLMPAIEYSNGEVLELPTKGVQGTSVIETHYPVVDWSKKQVISYSAKVPATAALIDADFIIDVYLHNCLSKAERVDRLYKGPLNLMLFPIAPIVTPADVVVGDVLGEAKPEGRIFFKVNSYVVTKEGTNNPSITNMNDMLKFLMQDSEFTITEVVAMGSASPEGTDRINKPLSANRAKAGITWMKSNLKNLGYKKTLKDDQYKINDSPDFWEGFFSAISASDHPRKSEIISQFLGYKSDPQEAEKRVREMMKNDQTVRDILFPDLRYTSLRVNFTRSTLTPDQLKDAARLYPAALSAKELTAVAEAQETLDQKVAIYKSALELHPTTWELYANLGNVYLKMKDYDAARRIFTDALQLDPNNAKIKGQLAYTHIIVGEYDKASQILQGVSGNDADYYRGIILAAQDKFEEAIPLLKAKPDVNLAISYLNTRQTKAAYDVLQKLDQEDVFVAYYTGVTLRRLNREAEAETYFNKANRLNKGELNERVNSDFYVSGVVK
ncbi:MAG: tetratricopeptide repeat protein [Prevotellaceae bacterium]|jgi:tetratricopeptide (TPR) repeat protein|nr:tetratricopeptide repeat protein [Prevotellaceae bacterium]